MVDLKLHLLWQGLFVGLTLEPLPQPCLGLGARAISHGFPVESVTIFHELFDRI
jgi:hypothetical protein